MVFTEYATLINSHFMIMIWLTFFLRSTRRLLIPATLIRFWSLTLIARRLFFLTLIKIFIVKQKQRRRLRRAVQGKEGAFAEALTE